MRLSLLPHPDTSRGSAAAIEVELSRPDAGLLDLRYVLTGDISALHIPPPAEPRRAEKLWNHTSFEAFLRGEGEAYSEFNLSPSGEWAAWRFEGYRCGMVPLVIEQPRIETGRGADRFELHAVIQLPPRVHRLALSAVIEEEDGTKSYWALAHPEGAPDFHDPACFAVELPPPAGA